VWTQDEGIEMRLECPLMGSDAVLQMFRSSHYLQLNDDLFSETSVHFYQTTKRHIPKDSQLHIQSQTKLKSHIDPEITTLKSAQFLNFAICRSDNAWHSLVVRHMVKYKFRTKL